MSFDEWREVKIEDTCRIRRGASPRPIQNFIRNSGIPWVKIADATSLNSRYIEKTKEFITPEGKNKSRFIEKGTLILSNSATPGLPKIMGINACVHDGWLIIDEFKNIDKVFLYYTFILERDKLLNLSNGSVFRNLKTDIVKSYKIKIPPLDEQKAIANILSTLDEKIEVNNQINQTLENMAQELFKRWFVDFEFPNEDGAPYQSSGGEMIESELGLIPKRWRVGGFEDLGKIISGGTPSKSNEEYFTKSGIAWITPKDLSNNRNKFVKNGATDITEMGLKNSSTKLMPKGSVLYSSRAPIGYIAIADNEVSTNQGFKSIVPHENISSEFVFQMLKNNTDKIIGQASGSTFKEISGKGMKSIKIIIPEYNVLDAYSKLVSPFLKMIRNNENSTLKLKNLRDTLLPKLMSGEIRVPLEGLEESLTEVKGG